MVTSKPSLCLFAFLLFGNIAFGWSPLDTAASPKSSFFDHLENPAPVKVTMKMDIASFLAGRRTSKGYYPAEMEVNFPGQEAEKWPLQIGLRGKSRRINCDFPPIKLRVSKSALKSEGLSTHNDMKLVTHCLNDPDTSRRNILREYLTYQLYRQLTPLSFRVQLLEVTYVDTVGNFPPMTRLGMLIEDFDELAERLQGVECDSLGLGTKGVDPAQENLMSAFQYFVGNTDWDSRFLRNIKAVKQDAEGKRLLIPYDFDYSGIVKAPYAKPRRELGQTKVGDRVFMGQRCTPEVVKNTINHFQKNREAINDVVRNFELLDRSSRNEILEYLRDFYVNIDSFRRAALNAK